jgi:putative membrane protein
MIRAISSITVLSAVVLAAPALAAQPAQPPATAGVSPGESPRLGTDDRDFFDDAAQGGLLEVKLGEHVVKQGASEEVKHFAQRMIDHHTKANQRLAVAGHQDGLSMPQDLDKKHQDTLDRFTQLAGSKLDQEYLDEMVSEHKDDVKAFEHESKDGKDLALKQFAASTLPTLQEHLTQARQLHDHLKK